MSYRDIDKDLGVSIPKPTMATWCKGVELPEGYMDRLNEWHRERLVGMRKKALVVNRRKREQFFEELRVKCGPVAESICDPDTAKIALAMLCLGEASKYSKDRRGPFCFANSNPEIITIFLKLMYACFSLKKDKFRCTVQCRADQDTKQLECFWQGLTGIPFSQFYPARPDTRTEGKPTRRPNYKGVLRIDYLDVKIQHELEMVSRVVHEIIQPNNSLFLNLFSDE